MENTINEEVKNELDDLKEVQEEFAKLKCDIIPKSDLKDNIKYFGVECDIDCNINIEFMKNYLLSKVTQRFSKYYIDFSSNETTLKLKIFTEMPEIFDQVYSQKDLIVATTFPDFCWIHAEGTTPQTLNEINTKVRDGIKLSDLAWILPSKMADDFVEIMHTLNQSIISGLMEESIIYGLYFFNKKDI